MTNIEQNAQGLYVPEMEHDACGIGFVAHLKNSKSHKIVTQALDGTPWWSRLRSM